MRTNMLRPQSAFAFPFKGPGKGCRPQRELTNSGFVASMGVALVLVKVSHLICIQTLAVLVQRFFSQLH